jgi:hypothetical protein
MDMPAALFPTVMREGADGDGRICRQRGEDLRAVRAILGAECTGPPIADPTLEGTGDKSVEICG